MLDWVKGRILDNYPSITESEINFEDGFYNGIAFCYIIHSYAAQHIRLDVISKHDSQDNLKQAFETSWNVYQIPFIIQNFNINRRTIVLFLTLLFEKLAPRYPVSILIFFNIRESNYFSREVATAFSRKHVFEWYKDQYTDEAQHVVNSIKV